MIQSHINLASPEDVSAGAELRVLRLNSLGNDFENGCYLSSLERPDEHVTICGVA